MQKVSWRGTIGVGDFMMALNSCHMHAYTTKVPVHLTMHWNHSEDYIHHFEDPETIIERMSYIHNYYHRKDDVTVSHVFNSTNDRYHKPEDDERDDKPRWWFESGDWPDMPKKIRKAPDADWLFRKDAFRERTQRKIVIWRPLDNAAPPTDWKNRLTNDKWDVIISKLLRRGMNITELNYRTPIREALYHISTARLVICYDGMWHYIARNLATPMVVISKSGVTTYHTPHAIRASHKKGDGKDIFWWTSNMSQLLGHSKKKANRYYDRVKYIYED